MAFKAPVTALAVINQIGLVATADDVQVVDMSDARSLQRLGKIALADVARLTVAPPDFWAGFVPEAGWFVLAAPQFLSPAESGHLQVAGATSAKPPWYMNRANLYNAHGVKTLPGFLYSTRTDTGQTIQAGHDGH